MGGSRIRQRTGLGSRGQVSLACAVDLQSELEVWKTKHADEVRRRGLDGPYAKEPGRTDGGRHTGKCLREMRGDARSRSKLRKEITSPN
jgi:hypothetical protein